MKKKIRIELQGKWVLAHRTDDVLPVAKLKEAYLAQNIAVEAASLTSLTLVAAADGGEETLKKILYDTFAGLYPDVRPEEICTLTLTEATETEGSAADKPAAEGESEEEARKREEIARITEEAARQVRERAGRPSGEGIDRLWGGPSATGEQAVKSVMEEIGGLVGADEFKALAEEIVRIAPAVTASKNYSVFYSRSYLFSIGDGCGLTTYLGLLARLLSATGLRKMSASPVYETRLEPYREMRDNREPFEELYSYLLGGSPSSVRILCFDISEWMARTENFYFKKLLRAIERASEKFIVVFRVPFLDKDVLASLNFSLNDLLSVKTVTFPPFGREELKLCAERELRTFGYKATDDAWECFLERIAEEKGDGKFYGLNTVKKVVRELVYNKFLYDVKKEKKSDTIVKRTALSLCAKSAADGIPGMEQLDRLVGLESVKEQIKEIVAQIASSAQGDPADRPCIHMRFVGNPGTGKTTVARILGKILKEQGLLRIGNFYECMARDLCGKYIGETAPKTASYCRDAYGSVLFIDEAYSLYRGPGNDRDYGREVIDTLIAEMENHRSDFVVIMAGYTDDMEVLMDANRGLASRMPYRVEFPNFSREQLYEIFVSMVQSRFKHDDRLFGAAHEYFTALPDEVISAKEFSNARFVRNLFERTWAKAAMRSQLDSRSAIVLTKDDFDRATREKEFMFNQQKKTRLGF